MPKSSHSPGSQVMTGTFAVRNFVLTLPDTDEELMTISRLPVASAGVLPASLTVVTV